MTGTVPGAVRVRAQRGALPDGCGLPRAVTGDRVTVRSAGSVPGDAINPVAVQVMAEHDIDIEGAQPALLSTEDVRVSDVVITMGCGDACPILPGKRSRTGGSTTL